MADNSPILDLLGSCDVVGLTETGCLPEEDPTVLTGFTCVCNLPREHEPKCGGVALYVREGWDKWVHVVRSDASRGVLWARLHVPGTAPVHVAVCYLPPGESQVRGRARPQQHAQVQEDMERLCEEACGFKRQGAVCLMGDFNARTGQDSDVIAMDWSEGGAPDLAMPPASLLDHLPPRTSKDCTTRTNFQGKQLLNLCKEAGLAIMNGRVPCDSTQGGQYTFEKHGRRSTVDYFVASPELAFELEGVVMDGCELRVLSYEERPVMPGLSSRFDHSPVFFTCVLEAEQDGQQDLQPRRGQRGAGCMRFSWDPVFQEHYVAALQSNQSVGALLEQVEGARSVDEACEALGAAVNAAVGEVEGAGFKVKRPAGRGAPPGHQPNPNSWYTEECKDARRAMREAERVHGLYSAAAKAARTSYAKVVRRAKRKGAEARLEAQANQWYIQPAKFWRAFKSRMGCPLDGKVAEFTEFMSGVLGQGGAILTGGLAASHMQAHAEHFVASTPEASEGAACLNADITEVEVEAALRGIATNKAAGVDGMPAEFFSEASYEVDVGARRVKRWVLAGHLAGLFSRIFREGYPRAWCTCALTPVPKPKGDPSRLDDYRGIAVSPALSKIYSVVLLNRLNPWAEKAGVRAAGQAGFREGRGTMDNAFVLQHICERYAGAGLPLYGVFIDFRKAYDRVVRELMWGALQSLGVHGRMLAALQAMYAQVSMQVRLGGQLGEPFAADMGVKQGDPLSPLLFGLFIDRFEGFLAKRCADMGALVAGEFQGDVPGMAARLLRVLFYADDLLLLAHSPAQLQAMLDAMQDFCTANGMEVNVAKSVSLVCGKPPANVPAFMYGGTALPGVVEFPYLGVPFTSGGIALDCLDRAVARATAACQALLGRCTQMGLHNVAIRANLFNTLVMPSLTYGCEIWGVFELRRLLTANQQWGGKGKAEALHRSFLYRCMGVKPSTPYACIMAATGRSPVAHAWLTRVLKWWNGVVQRDHEDVVRIALIDSCSSAEVLPARMKRATWASTLCSCLHTLNADWGRLVQQGASLPVTAVVGKAHELWQASVRGGSAELAEQPNACPVRSVPEEASTGFKLHTFEQWFEWPYVKGQGFVYHVHSQKRIFALAQFFFGAHQLEIERGRFVGGKRPRSERVCRCCQTGEREDELHFLLECPAYEDLRIACGTVFSEEVLSMAPEQRWSHMRDVTQAGSSAKHWNALAEFLVRAMAKRKEIYRVSEIQ